jgi:serine/threonine protein kinase
VAPGLERFTIEREAGRGACSTVHRARDGVTGETVAVKRLHFHDPELFQRFMLEAETLASIAHPNIVRYVAHGVDADGMPWVAMEWLEGEDLERRLERGPLSPEVAIDSARQAAAALAAAHAKKLIHRDVKPSNLFLVGDEVKILDFGIARVEGARTTETGRVIGTPAYIAPEQARGERNLDGRVDVYSLGLTLWEMLTGYSPFKSSSRVATLARIVTTGVPRLRSARADAPAWLDDLVARATAFDASDRFSTMLDFEAALAQASLQAHTAAMARTDISVPPPPLRSIPPRRISDRILTVLVAGRFESDAAELAAARVVLAEGGVTVPLRGGRLLAHLGADRTHGDEVLRAFRCAERLVSDHGVRVAIATGKGRQMGRRLEGAVAQAAAELFDASILPPAPGAAPEPATRRTSGAERNIVMDAPTRQLLRGARG